MTRITMTAIAVAAVTGAGPAAAIEAFANYSGVGGANMYWQRTGTTYTVATPAYVAPPLLTLVRGTAAQKAAIRAANTLAQTNYTNAVAAAASAATAATAASQASALATAGGNFFTISTPGATTPGAVAATFTFLNPVLYKLGPLSASYRLDAVASAGSVAQSAAGYAFQPIMSGTFAFTYTGTAALRVHHTVYRTGANLLTARFTGAGIIGQNGATSGAATASTSVAGETITYTSDLIDFSRTLDQDLAISMSSITAALGFAPYQALNSFAATTTGSFSTDPLPTLSAAVPEPAVWATMLAGFGLVGSATRRRTPTVAA